MKRLLIVDDMPEYVNSLKNALKSDFDIITALNLDDAKKQAKNANICLVDIRLDENNIENKDGLIFWEWMKENFSNVPVVLMSAYMSKEELKDMEQKGMIIMKKPIYLAELKSKLKSLVKETK